jgi:hypothetical protein
MPDFCRWHNWSIGLGILDDLADRFPDPLFQTLVGVSPSDGSFSGPEMLEFCEREGLLYRTRLALARLTATQRGACGGLAPRWVAVKR